MQKTDIQICDVEFSIKDLIKILSGKMEVHKEMKDALEQAEKTEAYTHNMGGSQRADLDDQSEIVFSCTLSVNRKLHADLLEDA